MSRRGFLAALAGAAGARFFCPTGAHAAAPVVAPVAPAAVAEVVRHFGEPPTPRWIAHEALRLLTENLDSLDVDRLELPEDVIERRPGDSCLVRSKLGFVPFADYGLGSLVETQQIVTLQGSYTQFGISPFGLRDCDPKAFSHGFISPAMAHMADRLKAATGKTAHENGLLVTLPLPKPTYLRDSVVLSRNGISLRLCVIVAPPPVMMSGNERLYRFDVLHGVAEL